MTVQRLLRCSNSGVRRLALALFFRQARGHRQMADVVRGRPVTKPELAVEGGRLDEAGLEGDVGDTPQDLPPVDQAAVHIGQSELCQLIGKTGVFGGEQLADITSADGELTRDLVDVQPRFMECGGKMLLDRGQSRRPDTGRRGIVARAER